MSVDIQDSLNTANPNGLSDLLNRITLGDIVRGLVPRKVARSGLSSSATQVHSLPGPIFTVEATAGTALAIVTGTAAGGEVQVTYDDDGLATLVFGDGALTGYTVTQTVIPSGLATLLAETSPYP